MFRIVVVVLLVLCIDALNGVSDNVKKLQEDIESRKVHPQAEEQVDSLMVALTESATAIDSLYWTGEDQAPRINPGFLVARRVDGKLIVVDRAGQAYLSKR